MQIRALKNGLLNTSNKRDDYGHKAAIIRVILTSGNLFGSMLGYSLRQQIIAIAADSQWTSAFSELA